MNEREDTVPAVDQGVTVPFGDPARAQGLFEQVVHHLAELGLRRVGPGGGAFNIHSKDGPMARRMW
jgi:hypothetical protein